jgi:two-component system alkaline phosphatase synthesis response regulator PhoP
MSRKHLLLVVDDEDDIREVAGLSLDLTEGWTVLKAKGGAAGLELATSSHPDAILLDVMMPDWDGPTTLRALQGRETTESIPVIFLTAKVQESDRQRFMQMGVRGIIAKPFDPLTLGQQIKSLLAWS